MGVELVFVGCYGGGVRFCGLFRRMKCCFFGGSFDVVLRVNSCCELLWCCNGAKEKGENKGRVEAEKKKDQGMNERKKKE